MQISITAGNFRKRDVKEAIGKYQESGNNRRVTRHRACSGHNWGTRMHGTGRMCEWMILIMNKTERMMKIINVQKYKQKN